MEVSGPAIITGAAGGIGRAIALRFVDFKCRNLTLVDQNADGLAETKDLIFKQDPSVVVHTISCDLTADGAPEMVVRESFEKFNALYHLVNCAGTPGGFATSQETDIDMFDRVQSLNVRAAWLLQKAAIQRMLTQNAINGERGSIVNIGSLVSHVGLPALSAYTTSKHALLGMTRSEAVDFASEGIRINLVAPGLVSTDLGRAIPAEIRDHHLTPVLKRTPMGRFATPQEVANCVAFLSSQLAAYITGINLPIDGGYSAM
ncbi:hypothetical protein BKA66DRAFT_567598 [Pyrenochaeta sp. MPI-SDFR-AT-0127]|nr:hypothetical protein BKA66DRAFT_567598 [Pyrenochaeta sp. MPI-SDFR-AT-0127]